MKIYIVSEYNSISGGAESLQQLCYILKKKGYESYIYYLDSNEKKAQEKFLNYNNKITTEVEDKKKNILIVPESYTEFLVNFENIKKVIWWLSLDFYLNNKWINRTVLFCNVHSLPKVLFPLAFLYLFLSRKLKRHLYKHENGDQVFHLYNCEYVNNYLNKIGVKDFEKLYLCGPLSDEYFYNDYNYKRQNIILYNPKKGIKFTKKIISKSKNLKFIPIENMDAKEIKKLMKCSKVYIDFGYFPGPERIPREAVISGCNIITSTLGSANNSQDVPIPNKYKFEIKDDNIDKILLCIEDLLENYEIHYKKFNKYRDKVINQKEIFELNITEFLKRIEEIK